MRSLRQQLESYFIIIYSLSTTIKLALAIEFGLYKKNVTELQLLVDGQQEKTP